MEGCSRPIIGGLVEEDSIIAQSRLLYVCANVNELWFYGLRYEAIRGTFLPHQTRLRKDRYYMGF